VSLYLFDMKILFLLLAIVGMPFLGISQNLVPNPSFEIYTELPNHMINSSIHLAEPWFDAPAYPGGGGSSADYININMPLILYNGDTYDFQSPNSGNAYVDIFTCWYNLNSYGGEAIEVRLDGPMQIGELYSVSFYVKKAQIQYGEGACHYGSDELGIYFHTDTIYMGLLPEHIDTIHGETVVEIENAIILNEELTNEFGNSYYAFSEYLQEPDIVLDTVINDEENWYLVTDTFYADKAYEFMIFCQFRPFEEIQWEIDSTCGWASAYSMMMIDDVSIHLLEEEHIDADAGADATICLGDSIQIGTSEYEDYMYWWSPNEQMPISDFGGVNPGMPWVSPTETTTYTLTQKDFAFEETLDQITITVDNCGYDLSENYASQIKVYPNPATSIVEIESGYAISSCKLLDALGKEVASSKYLESSTNLNIDVSSFEAGLYFLEMEIEGQKIIKQLVIE